MEKALKPTGTTALPSINKRVTFDPNYAVVCVYGIDLPRVHTVFYFKVVYSAWRLIQLRLGYYYRYNLVPRPENLYL